MRSLICIPCDRPEFLEKAVSLNADVVIFDLEDGVSNANKSVARNNLTSYLTANQPKFEFTIRINALNSQEFKNDQELISELGKNRSIAIMCPKIETIENVAKLKSFFEKIDYFDLQIESPLGLLNSKEIASDERVRSLHFGPADFESANGSHSEIEELALNFPLQFMVLAAHAANKLAISGPTFDLADNEKLKLDSRFAKGIGADGKWAIHPKQIDVINEIFTPSESEISWAKKVVAAGKENNGAFMLEGKMQDEATIKVAQRLLDKVTRFRKLR